MADAPADRASSGTGLRALSGYVIVAILTVIGLAVAWLAGSTTPPPFEVGGRYTLEANVPCVGNGGAVVLLTQSGLYVSIGPFEDTSSKLTVEMRLEGRHLAGDGRCQDGTAGSVAMDTEGTKRADALVFAPGGERARFLGLLEHIEKLSPEEIFAHLALAIAVVILAARAGGSLVARLGQPRVMGEVLAGILLGPTLFGLLFPTVQATIFPTQIVPLLAAAANIGLAFYMFMVGMELDPRTLKGRVSQAAFISNTSVAIPMALGFLLAVGLYPTLAPIGVAFLPFALFIGVSMSITAFPVLARILVERRMLRRPVGVLALASAAVDDVTAWALLAVATAVASVSMTMNEQDGLGPVLQLVRVVGLSIVFCLVMGFGVRRLLARVSSAYDDAGHVPTSWIAFIFLGVLLATATTGFIGIAPIFGAFVMGLAMPRREELSHDVQRRMEDFIVIVLLPIFFVVAGLKVNAGLLRDPQLIVVTLVIIGVAILAKLVSASLAARWTGMSGRESAAIGVLLNTRGLTELIVLNLGLDLGVISPALFTMLVVMALVTTFMTGPLLRLVDPKGLLTLSPREELQEVAAAEPVPIGRPDRAVLAVVLDDRHLDPLTGIGADLTKADPPRELIVVRLLEPGPITSGVSSLDRRLDEANAQLELRRSALAAAGIPVRVAALTSSRPGRDLVRLAGGSDIDLVVVDGRPPLIGNRPLGGSVGRVLEDLTCDVAVLIGRAEGRIELGPARPVVVPFGGAEHDWAALEVAAGLAAGTGSPIRLLGVVRTVDGRVDDPTRLLANASVVLQQITGVRATASVIEGTPDGLAAAVGDGGLVVAGLSDRWREEGLGEARAGLARLATVPVLFVRRGSRPGLLAPPDDLTRFTWSFAGVGPPAAAGTSSPGVGAPGSPPASD